MAAWQWTPGPIDLFARFRSIPGGALGAWLYVGTCVTAPEPEHEQFKIPVMNDLGGRSVPFQLVQDGENAKCMCTVNRFDMAVIRAMRSASAGIGGGLGFESNVARGTLVIGVSDFQFTMVNRYYFAANQAVTGGPVGIGAGGMSAGRCYLSVNLRPYKESTAGTRVLEVAMALDFQNVYNTQTGAFALYTEDLSAVNFTYTPN